MYFLLTDYLLWALVILFALYGCWAKSQYIHRQAWSSIISNNGCCAALISFGFFLLIGLLDSVHFIGATPGGVFYGKIYSILDYWFSSYILSEVSYSKPFAAVLFNKFEVIKLEHVNVISSNFIWAKIIFSAFSLALVIVLSIIFCLSKFVKFGWVKRFTWYYQAHRLPVNILFIWVFAICLVCFLVPHYHLFGTDQIGDDLFYQCIKSIRTGLVIGGVTLFFMLPFAILLGLVAGFYGGVVDDIVQFIYTVLSSIPAVLLIAAAALALQVFISSHGSWFVDSISRADFKLLGLCFILGVTGWTPLARLLRAEAIKLKHATFVDAARIMGCSNIKIIFSHLLPNVMHLVLMALVLDFSGLVLAEAVLSYVGVGVDPSTYSWGNIINASRLELARDPIVWWPIVGAFVFMFLLVLSINILADGLRQSFNPKSY